MATTMPDTELNAIADYQAGRIAALSLHEATPGTTGASEAAGGSPAYARQAVTFAAAGMAGPLGSASQPATPGIAWSSQVTFDVDPATYTHYGCWSATTGGTFRHGNSLATAQVVSSQGQIKLSIGVKAVPAT